MPSRLWTIEDFADIEPTGNKFEDLASVAARAYEREFSSAQHPESKRKRYSTSPFFAAISSPGDHRRAKSPEGTKRKRPPRQGESSAAARDPKYRGPQPAPPLPENFRNKIQEIAEGRKISEFKLVIQKGLFSTDVSGGHNRLSIPFNQIDNRDFLTEQEKTYLDGKDDENKCNVKEVRIIEPSLKVDSVNLRRWDMKKPKGNGKTSSSYVLNGSWNQIVKDNELKEGTVVQLWAVRIERELCFALVTLPPRGYSN